MADYTADNKYICSKVCEQYDGTNDSYDIVIVTSFVVSKTTECILPYLPDHLAMYGYCSESG